MQIQLLSFVNCLSYLIYTYYCGVILYQKKIKFHWNWIIAILLFVSGFYLTLYYFTPFFSIFFTYFIYVLFHRLVFQENWIHCFSGALITYTIRLIFEFIIILCGWELKDTVYTYHVYSMSKFYVNTFIVCGSLMSTFLLKKQLVRLKNYISKTSNRQFLIFLILYLDVVLMLLFRGPRIQLNLELLADVIIIFLFTTISLLNAKQESAVEDLSSYYDKLFEYSKLNEKVIQDYKVAQHENKNQLLIIKGMLSKLKEDKEIHKYIDSLLEEKKKIENVDFGELSYIPISGVKSFFYYKLLQMRNIGSQVELVVSPDLANVDFSFLEMDQLKNFYSILGVILDNMIDALKEADQKLASIQLYLIDSIIHCEFANSFKGKVDLDKVTTPGYTTKGQQHGVGLYLVSNIIKKNETYDLETKIEEPFFVQHLQIDLTKAERHKKTTLHH